MRQETIIDVKKGLVDRYLLIQLLQYVNYSDN